MKERILQERKRKTEVRENAPIIRRKTKYPFLLNLCKKKPCFWDVFNKDYSKPVVRDTAYKEIAGVFGCNITSISGKINALRAQKRITAKAGKVQTSFM